MRKQKGFTPLEIIKANRRYKESKSLTGFTLIDVLVGTFLVLIVFLGIFSAYQLGLKVVGQNKNRVTATAIAIGELEKIRNLPYESIGIKNGILPVPDGILEATTTVTRNNIEYKIERQIKYIIDAADGIGGADLCDWDYKRAEIKTSWSGQFGGEVKLVTDVAPKNKVEEISACTAQPGGILSVEVANFSGMPVPSPLVEIINPATGEIVDSMQPFEGKQDFPLVPATYKVVVSKPGYNSSRTYGTNEVVTPENPHPIVLEGKLTEISFAGDSGIEKVSSLSVDTLSPWGTDYFSDSFSDTSKVSQFSDLEIGGGEAILAQTDGQYKDSGYLISTDITPANLIGWDEFSFNDLETTDTQIIYQILYFNSVIPDEDLVGNSDGFGTSPVNLSGLDIVTYPQLKVKANLSTSDTAVTPIFYDWQVSWVTSEATPIPNATFNLQGAKIIGTDADENSVYKYSREHNSESDGHIDISNLEWDNYTFSINPTTGLDLQNIDPFPQPVGLLPDANLLVKLYLDAENSLFVTVQDIETSEPIFLANVELSKLGYDETQGTNEQGQTYFIPLDVGVYTIDVSLDGYQTKSEGISVSGDESVIISLQRFE